MVVRSSDRKPRGSWIRNSEIVFDGDCPVAREEIIDYRNEVLTSAITINRSLALTARESCKHVVSVLIAVKPTVS
jgi:hypothetical protein